MKRIFSLATSLLVAGAMYAQSDPKLPEVVPPSPTVANLMKFEEVPIDYHSGQPNISIPLFSKEIGSGIGVNIGLNYSTTGIQIDNRSGWTGTGWSLFAGGSISRTVRDVADEAKKNTVNFDNNTGVLYNTSFWNYSNNMPGLQEYLWKSVGDSQDKYDTNLDLYQFNFMGYNGRFVVVKNGSTLQAKLLSKTSNLKISLSYSTSPFYKINSFTITDTKGYKYTFDQVEVTTYHVSNETMSQGTQSQVTNGTSSDYTVNSAWHLSKVETPKGDDLLTLSYASHGEGYLGLPSRVENSFRFPTTALNNLANDPYNQGVMEPKYSISQTDISVSTKKLSSITFRDGTSISLTSTAGHPEVGSGNGRILSSVVLKDVNNNAYKTYNLTYQTVASRLWLTRVSETAGSFTLNTDLSYHNKHLLPAYGNGVNQADSWGYYSGINNPSTFNANQIKTGLLTKIAYATGGVKEFEFEHNSYSYYGNTVIPTSDYHTFSSSQTLNTSISSEEMIGGGVRIKNVVFKDSPTAIAAKQVAYRYKLENASNKSSGVIDAKQDRLTRDYIININKVFLPLSNSTSQIQYDVKLWGPNMNVQMTKGNYVEYRHVKVEELKDIPGGTENNGYSLYDYTSAFDFPMPSAVFSLPNSAPSPNLDFKRGLLKKQRVYNKSGNILKQVENTYAYQEDFIYKQRAMYRFEQTKQFYDTWNFYNASQGNSAEINNISNYSNYGYTPNPAYALTQDFNAGWAKLTESKTKDYFYKNGVQSVVESRKTYEYNTNNYQVATENNIMDEGGSEIYYQTKLYYPVGTHLTGGTSTTVRSRLATLNKVNEVLASVTTRSVGAPILGGGDVMSKSYTVYDYIDGDSNVVLPIRVELAKGTSNTDSRIEFHKYDVYGNPIEVSQKDGTRIVYIWGYDKTLPIAKIENATYSDVSSYITNIQNKSNADDDATIDTRNSNGSVATYVGDEGQLRSALDNLRTVPALSDALITTFTYNPSVGVTSITDPSGNTIYYFYDALNRLEMVKDAFGKIVSKNEYNYKN